MTRSTLHVVFTPSGAGSLRQALANAGRNDPVVAFFDDLSFGPINPPDSSLRAKWVEDELSRTGWDCVAAKSERFWHEALSPDYRKVAWLSRRSAMEYAGFLEWLWRLGDEPCETVDLTDLKVSRRPEHGPPTPAVLVVSLGGLSPREIAESNFFGQATILSTTARGEYQALWEQLRADNAPLRVLDGGTLVPAPISFFDSLLMSHVTDDWQKVAMIVGLALVSQMDDRIFQTGDIFLVARVNALVEAGRLELQGESAFEMHASKVRLPAVR
jgi:Protein of unknown function/Domain of unknown function (DUF1835)